MRKEIYQTLKEVEELSDHDKDRLMQCIKCENNPEDCGCTYSDEDHNGMCKKFRKAEIKEGIDACNNILQMGIFLEPKSSIEARKLTYEQCLEFIDKHISGKEQK